MAFDIGLASRIRPVAPPQAFSDAYTPHQHRRLIEGIRKHGPWRLIIAQHFASAEELLATMSGSIPDGVTVSLDQFVTPTFRGYFAKGGVCLYPEIEDCFFNHSFLDRVRAYWKADYARPDQLLFNINGPCHNYDPAHLDATDFRGINSCNTPIWLMNTMTKSGLFGQWQMKKAQVITWFYRGAIGGGFTYWPDGLHAAPQRLSAPMWNRAVVVENEMMYHRGEGNGPVDRRKPKGLAFNSLLEADPECEDGWRVATDGQVIDHFDDEETRLLVHWSAEVFLDYAELTKVLDHSDDLTHDRVFDRLISDMKLRGLAFEVPTDPLHDPLFIRTLVAAYDLGEPHVYPTEAPGPQRLREVAVGSVA
jgi:hypothetical protein